MESSSSYYVYLLVSANGKATYVGSTVNLERRLRQHNGEIVGGAKYTTKRGPVWKRHCYVSNFPTWQAALQFEWRWKNLTRKIKSGFESPLDRRMKALDKLLSLERSTQNAVPFSLWAVQPKVNYEAEGGAEVGAEGEA